MYQKEVTNKNREVIIPVSGVGKSMLNALLSKQQMSLPTVVDSNIEFIIDDFQDKQQISVDIETYSNLQLLSDIDEAKGEE